MVPSLREPTRKFSSPTEEPHREKTATHLYRFGDLLLRSVRSGPRPQAGQYCSPGESLRVEYAAGVSASQRQRWPQRDSMDTAEGKTTGQWLQLDWDTPQNICGVVLHATGPWTQTIDVQIKRDGTWTSVGHSGSADEKTAVHTVVSFTPVSTKSIRFVFEGGAAYNEVEVYSDTKSLAQAGAEFIKPSIFVAGDLQRASDGHRFTGKRCRGRAQRRRDHCRPHACRSLERGDKDREAGGFRDSASLRLRGSD